MNEVWHARNGIVARGRARGRIRTRRPGPGRRYLAAAGGAAGPALPAGADLPAGLPGRDRAVRVHRGRERPAHRGRAVGQAGQPAGPGPAARPWDPMAGRYRVPDEKTIRVVLDRLDPRALARALLGRPGSRRGGGPPPAGVRPLPCPARGSAGKSAGAGPVKGRGRGRQDLPRGPAAPTAPGSTCPAPPSTAGTCWITARSTPGTTRPAISPSCRDRWTWPAPW
jgi:hypothetical protein